VQQSLQDNFYTACTICTGCANFSAALCGPMQQQSPACYCATAVQVCNWTTAVQLTPPSWPVFVAIRLFACRKYAWGSDEVDVINHKSLAWFNLGLTIVDSLDTLLIAGARYAAVLESPHVACHQWC
jgi:hypothetical protein